MFDRLAFDEKIYLMHDYKRSTTFLYMINVESRYTTLPMIDQSIYKYNPTINKFSLALSKTAPYSKQKSQDLRKKYFEDIVIDENNFFMMPISKMIRFATLYLSINPNLYHSDECYELEEEYVDLVEPLVIKEFKLTTRYDFKVKFKPKSFILRIIRTNNFFHGKEYSFSILYGKK